MVLQAADLKKYSYFSNFSNRSLDFLVEKISTVNFPAGSEIIREGERGDSLYVVKEGQLEVSKKGSSNREIKLSTIDDGQIFGEQALITCSLRSSSVRAKTDIVLYKLLKVDFENIILQESTFKAHILDKIKGHAKYNEISSLKPFERLSPDKMSCLMEKLTEQTFCIGEDIIVQKEKGDSYYIIKSGRVGVLKKGSGEQEYKKVAELRKGDAFGEEALIRDDPRGATCRAIDETTVYVLSKIDFDEIVKQSYLEVIYPNEISLASYLDDYIFIDARITPEYDEEHIHGSINIPIEVLRHQCNVFDKKKKYITYCLNDSRGMVAAFLMKNRDFDVQYLRGGLSGWEGPIEVGAAEGVYLPE